jgi:hypothetical protein
MTRTPIGHQNNMPLINGPPIIIKHQLHRKATTLPQQLPQTTQPKLTKILHQLLNRKGTV